MNNLLRVLFCLAIFSLSLLNVTNAAECNGCVILDSKTFDKVLSKFDIMLVKFDKYNPDSKKHAAFEQVATDLSKEVGMENMIAAHVDIFNNGEIKNTDLVTKYNLQAAVFDESLPVLAAFMKNKEGEKGPENETHSHSFIEMSETFDSDALKRAIRSNTGIYFVLPGCIDTFDFLAVKFAGGSSKQQGKAISAAEKALSQIHEGESENIAIAKEYISYMKKAQEFGADVDSIAEFIQQEVTKSEKKEEKMNQALNILDAFTLAGKFQMVEVPDHDEL